MHLWNHFSSDVTNPSYFSLQTPGSILECNTHFSKHESMTLTIFCTEIIHSFHKVDCQISESKQLISLASKKRHHRCMIFQIKRNACFCTKRSDLFFSMIIILIRHAFWILKSKPLKQNQNRNRINWKKKPVLGVIHYNQITFFK